MKRFFLILLLLSTLSILHGCFSSREGGGAKSNLESALPSGFTYIESIAPGVLIEMRYASDNNFIGKVVEGYESPKCIMTVQAAEAIRDVQAELSRYSMSLKIFDAYRPQKAVDHFVRWAQDLSDARMKKEYYPSLTKEQIFKDGYIWTKSNHSKGSTVDLTIVTMPSGLELDMGSGFDFFGAISNTGYGNLSQHQKINRLLLKSIMEKHGFVNYEKEWWHFTLRNEPFPDVYFNFPVK